VALAEFRSIDVLKLVISIIEGPLNETPVGAGLALDELEAKGYILEWFPLHDQQELNQLYHQWMQWFSGVWDQPLSRIRSYFGGTLGVTAARLVFAISHCALTLAEKVALYAAFSGHYTKWLLGPSLLGAAVYAHQLSAGELSVVSVPAFGVFIAVWATYAWRCHWRL